MRLSDHIWRGVRRLITGAFFLLTGLTLYYALLSQNFLLAAETTTWVTLVMLAALCLLVVILITDNPIRRGINWYRQKTGWWGMLLFGFLVLIVQGGLILATHPTIGFDAYMVHQALVDPTGINQRGYFSQNTNNLPLLLAEVGVSKLLGSTSWLTLDWATLVFVDIAALLNVVTIALINPQQIKTMWYLQGFGLLLFPSIIVPYTDTWVLPLVSLTLVGLVGAAKKWAIWWRSLFALIAGVGMSLTYFMKPSGIILVIGIGAVAIIASCRHLTWQRLGMGIWLMLLLAGSGYATYRQGVAYQDHQSFIKINRELEVPAIHFLSIGQSQPRGEYSTKEALAMAKLPKRADKVAYSKKMLKQHLQEDGFWGHLWFLIQKQGYNTADGTFGWLGEGTFMHAGKPSSDWRWLFQTFLYPKGANVATFRFVAQIAWVALLIVLVAGWQEKGVMVNGFRLTILGTYAFLLLFEGGRSRYLIQVLPEMLILGALLLPAAKQQIARLLVVTGLRKEREAK
ncbi:hypothetical protein H5993_00065 [Lactobacillus alvi]|uniref:Integral membrane protein n=1 Tax=Limosilactobacillus alvi TaxID=990412 RepID=A0ABS2EL36_9LACO|nr:TIGR03766 family XrtG-associated glycosyltransferase [Limosilactobacillus alvi]MBM6753163.1 hypothetical protein [Limosilactobacillus alvi]